MYALVNEIYDLKKRSYYNQRLLKVFSAEGGDANKGR